MKNLSGNASNWIEDDSGDANETLKKKKRESKKVEIINELKQLKKVGESLEKKYTQKTEKNLGDALSNLHNVIRSLKNLN